MKLVENILTKNPCYTAGRKITVKGLMIHSVGCPQPKASVFINNWNRESYTRACVHGFIDANDGTVYQTLPWDHRGWHCGSGSKGSGNNTHIGVEMCEPGCITYTGGAGFKVAAGKLEEAKACAKRTYEAAVELFAMLCGKFGLDPMGDGVIVSHAEGYKRGIASNHGDPEHLWRQLGMGYTMDGFRKDVKATMEKGGAAASGGSGNGSSGGSGSEGPTSGNGSSTGGNNAGSSTTAYPEKLTSGWYRVRKAWTDKKSQIGAYKVLACAKAKADGNAGYYVFDNAGRVIYAGKKTVAADSAVSALPSVENRKTNEQLANEVIRGFWGNGAERKKRMTEAGYDYAAVQAIVNKKLEK